MPKEGEREKMKKKLFSLIFAASISMALLAGCGGGQETATGTGIKAEGGTEAMPAGEAGVLYSNGGPTEFFETPWLNPGTYMYNKTLYARLLLADENLSPISGEGELASSYEMAEDGSYLKFTLRDGITWHDGAPITAEEIQWNIEYALKTTVLNSVFRSAFEAIEGSGAYLDGSAEHISGIVVDGNTIT